MIKIRILILFLLAFSSVLKSQKDTVIFDEKSGNYNIFYVDEDGSLISQVYVPWNKINPIINCHIVFDDLNKTFKYYYDVKNNDDSAQNLNYIILEHANSNIINQSTNGWYTSNWNKGEGIEKVYYISWSGDLGLEPSWSVRGFVISSNSLPILGSAFFQGSGGSVLSFLNSPPPLKIMREIERIDSFPNSFIKRTTLVPGAFLHIPLNDLLDSLFEFCEKSVLFNWIKNEPTYNKYNTLLTDAKTALEQSDTNSARTYLQNIITNVDIDSSSSLTSEAYALLKFNTEYLLDQLPEINIEDMFDILLNHVSECYNKEWIDNKGIMNSLTKKVERAKTDYLKGKIKTTINKLNSFRNELDAQKDKHLTSECYDLLFSYSNYIIEKLQ